MKTLTVRVLRRHIKEGNIGIFNCPILIALRECGFDLDEENGVLKMPWDLMPKSACRFVAKFDSGKPVSPFSFKLRIEE